MSIFIPILAKSVWLIHHISYCQQGYVIILLWILLQWTVMLYSWYWCIIWKKLQRQLFSFSDIVTLENHSNGSVGKRSLTSEVGWACVYLNSARIIKFHGQRVISPRKKMRQSGWGGIEKFFPAGLQYVEGISQCSILKPKAYSLTFLLRSSVSCGISCKSHFLNRNYHIIKMSSQVMELC